MKKFMLLTFLSATLSVPALAANANNDVALSGLNFQNTPNGLQAISGTGTNKTDHEINMIMVKFNLLQNGEVIGQTVDMANHIEPGQSWKIQATYNSIDLKPDSFRVTEIYTH